jgi:hypothetical protein
MSVIFCFGGMMLGLASLTLLSVISHGLRRQNLRVAPVYVRVAPRETRQG